MLFFPRLGFATLLYIMGVLCLISGCSNDSSDSPFNNIPKAVELEDFQTLTFSDDNMLGNPYLTIFDDYSGHLMVYDNGTKQVVKLDVSGKVKILGTFGGEGRGPGELSGAGNIFATEQYIYIVDPSRFFLHKYNRKGEPISSLDIGAQKSDGPGRPPAPTPPFPADLYGEAFVTLNGNVLVSSIQEKSSLYRLQSWEGTHLADIGAIPPTGVSVMDDEAYRKALGSGEVSQADKRRAFPVADKANPDELFLVYGAIPKIVKYDTTGRKLWEAIVPDTPEIDSLVIDHYQLLEMSSFEQRWPMRKYVGGVSSPDGDLYLTVYTNLVTPPSDNNRSLWIHRFNPKGKLIQRYKLKSKTDLLYYPGIDFSKRRFFVIPFGEAAIRAYSF